MLRVLFICMGNICRSPTAEGVLRNYVAVAGLEAQIEIDSAGTLDYHTGNPPDRRSTAAAANRGIDITSHRARQVTPGDIEQFDYILAMDHDNLHYLQDICPAGLEGKLQLFLTYAPRCARTEVPDPYHGDGRGFETVLDLVDLAAQGLLAVLCERLERDGRSA